MKTQFFLILPEYLNTQKDFEILLSTLSRISDFLRRKKDFNLFYSSVEVTQLSECIHELVDEYTKNPDTQIGFALGKSAKDITDSFSDTGEMFYAWKPNEALIEPVKNNILKALLQRRSSSLIDEEHSFVIDISIKST